MSTNSYCQAMSVSAFQTARLLGASGAWGTLDDVRKAAIVDYANSIIWAREREDWRGVNAA